MLKEHEEMRELENKLILSVPKNKRDDTVYQLYGFSFVSNEGIHLATYLDGKHLSPDLHGQFYVPFDKEFLEDLVKEENAVQQFTVNMTDLKLIYQYLKDFILVDNLRYALRHIVVEYDAKNKTVLFVATDGKLLGIYTLMYHKMNFVMPDAPKIHLPVLLLRLLVNNAKSDSITFNYHPQYDYGFINWNRYGFIIWEPKQWTYPYPRWRLAIQEKYEISVSINGSLLYDFVMSVLKANKQATYLSYTEKCYDIDIYVESGNTKFEHDLHRYFRKPLSDVDAEVNNFYIKSSVQFRTNDEKDISVVFDAGSTYMAIMPRILAKGTIKNPHYKITFDANLLKNVLAPKSGCTLLLNTTDDPKLHIRNSLFIFKN